MYTAGLRDLPDGTAAPNTLEELDALVQRMSFAVISTPLAPALQGGRVVRGQYGLASRRMLTPSLSRDTRRSPNFAKALFHYLSLCFPRARVSSCTIAFHRHAPLHADRANIGPSYAVALRGLSGGHLWFAPPFALHGATLRVTEQLCEFDSLVMHTTLPYDGPRYYISFYCHRAVGRITRLVRRRLLDLCVPLPSVFECANMLRAAQQRPPLCQRRSDGFKQWAAYLNTLPREQRAATATAQKRKGGSWVCNNCHKFGPLGPSGGRQRLFCSRACEASTYRSRRPKPKPQRAHVCRQCGRVFRQWGARGGQLRYCRGCRRKRRPPTSAPT